METKGERLEGKVFINADVGYTGKFDYPQGGNTSMLMQQVTEVMTVNQEIKNKSTWISVSNVGADGVSAAVGMCEIESR